jgi:hypothetical protein
MAVIRKWLTGMTALTEAGPVEFSVPRDRDSSFEPKIVANGRNSRRLPPGGMWRFRLLYGQIVTGAIVEG